MASRMLLFATCLVQLQVCLSQATNYCIPGTSLPENLLHCGSCSNRCGASGTTSGLMSNGPIGPQTTKQANERPNECFCDESCLFYGDCCHDFENTCGTEFQKASDNANLWSQSGHTNFICLESVLLVATCSNGSRCLFRNELNNDPNTFVPMCDLERKVNYVSGYCALCNRARKIEPWGVSVNCRSESLPSNLPSQGGNYIVNSTQSLDSATQGARCELELKVPEAAIVRKCETSLISTCRPNCANQELLSLCTSAPLEYIYVSGYPNPYRNAFCALCRDPSPPLASLGCQAPPPTPPPPPPTRPPLPPQPTGFPVGPPGAPGFPGVGGGGPPGGIGLPEGGGGGRFVGPPGAVRPQSRPGGTSIAGTPTSSIDRGPSSSKPASRPAQDFSLTFVFDFDPRMGLTVGQHEYPECDIGEEYNRIEGMCRAITCPTGQVLDGNTCIPQLSTIVIEFQGSLVSPVNDSTRETIMQHKDNLDTKISQSADLVFSRFEIIQMNFGVDSNFEAQESSVHVLVNMSCNCNFANLLQSEENGGRPVDSNFRKDLLRATRDHILDYFSDYKVAVTEFTTELMFELTNSSLAAQDTCTWFVFETTEVSFRNSTIENSKTETVEVTGTGETFPSEKFERLENVVIICLDVKGPENENEPISLALGVVSLICIGISIVCLLARLLLQRCVARFQSKPGKLHFHLSCAFSVAFVFLILGPFMSSNEHSCVVAAAILCYGFFAAFTWMNIIAFDTWLVFRPSGTFSKSSDSNKHFIKYVILGWVIPLCLVTIVVGMNYASIEETFQPMFGGARCWFTQRLAMLIYFGVPVAISILLNIYLYIHTSINLHRAFNKERARLNRNEHHFFIYVRLFVLMGFTWIFGFLSAFLDEVAIDFIFVILTSLQGLFLFLSFVCNKHVLSDIKKKFKRDSSSTSDEKRSNGIQLPQSSGATSSTSLSSTSPTPKPPGVTQFSFPETTSDHKDHFAESNGDTNNIPSQNAQFPEDTQVAVTGAPEDIQPGIIQEGSNGCDFTLARETMKPPSPKPEEFKPETKTRPKPPVKPKPIEFAGKSQDRVATPPPVPPKRVVYLESPVKKASRESLKDRVVQQLRRKQIAGARGQNDKRESKA